MDKATLARANYLDGKLIEVNRALDDFECDDRKMLVGYKPSDMRTIYDDLWVECTDEFIYAGLLNLLQNYKQHLLDEFKKL